jgi:GNAT superfamily N-acetyltransferase
MSPSLRISHLADYPEAIPVIRRWFEREWAAFYGPGGPGDAERDLLAYSSRGKLPVGLIAFYGEQLCGIAVLKAHSLSTHTHVGPWAAAGLVLPPFRGRGIGSRLLQALEEVARSFGYSTLYCGTATAIGLLERNGWQFMERVRYPGEEVSIYHKALEQDAAPDASPAGRVPRREAEA